MKRSRDTPASRSQQIRNSLRHPIIDGDAPLDTCAFNPKINPFKATLQAMLGSDIGHWDVPDIRGIVEEAYEHVEHGLITEGDFEKFTFSNIVRLHGGMNPSFFTGTNVEGTAAAVLCAPAELNSPLNGP